MTNRKINFNTIWQRAKIRPILLLFSFQGIGFSLFLLLPLAIMTNSLADRLPYVDNVEKIKSDGKEINGTLTNIEAVNNITINGNNPQILTFEFDVNGEKNKSKFAVFKPEKTNNLKAGDKLPVKHIDGEAIPTEYEQYTFNMGFMYYIAGALFLIGLIPCYLLYRRIKKEITLYKTGRVKDGQIISIIHNKGFTFTKFGASMDVHYKHGDIVAKSKTNNYALLNNKSIGDIVKILVSVDDKSSCLYPELIAAKNGWKYDYNA